MAVIAKVTMEHEHPLSDEGSDVFARDAEDVLQKLPMVVHMKK